MPQVRAHCGTVRDGRLLQSPCRCQSSHVDAVSLQPVGPTPAAPMRSKGFVALLRLHVRHVCRVNLHGKVQLTHAIVEREFTNAIIKFLGVIVIVSEGGGYSLPVHEVVINFIGVQEYVDGRRE